METADGATAAEQEAAPQAQSLIERARQVVETQFVDEAFTVSARHCPSASAQALWWALHCPALSGPPNAH